MKKFNLKYLLFLIPLLSFYFLSRCQNLNQIPVFGDEAIYVRWAQLIKNVETLRFVPLSDGKEPLFMWLNAITLKIVSDPLVAGRIISVLAGAGIIAVIFVFCLLFFDLPVALISSVIYLCLPFAFFFDRMALADNLLAFFGTLSLLFAVLLAKFPRLDLSLILGFCLGLAWLTKSPAIYFIVLSLVTFLFLNLKNISKIYLSLISAFLAFIIYNILRLGPQFQQIALRNMDYVWPLSTVFKHPLDPLVPHLKDIVNISNAYISLPIILTALIGLLLLNRKFFQDKIILTVFAWFILPLIATAAVAKVFTARYILFCLPAFIILLSIFISNFFNQFKFFHKKLFLVAVFVLFISIPNIIYIYRLSVDPFHLTLPPTETGYLSDWTSGWGIKTASKFLISRSHSANVIVGTEGYFGTLPDGLQIYTDSLKQLTVFGVGVDLNQIPPKLIDARQHGDEVYLLLNKSRNFIPPDHLSLMTLVSQYPKPGNDYLELYRLN